MKTLKPLQIVSSKIVVTRNPYSAKGYYVFHKVKGILPGCRKASDLTISAMYGCVWIKNLWSYHGSANITPEDWAALVNTSPVVQDNLESFKYPLTPEVIKDAYSDALRVVNCEAVNSREHVHPSYTGPGSFNPLVMVNRA
jgi:hypothetical protein